MARPCCHGTASHAALRGRRAAGGTRSFRRGGAVAEPAGRVVPLADDVRGALVMVMWWIEGGCMDSYG